MTTQIPDWPRAKVLVVGDLMLDRYWDGATRRISPEAPVPVVAVANEHERVGGAANVAAGITALGASARLIGCVGADVAGEQLDSLCKNARIETDFLCEKNRATTIKLRVLSQHQQLLRLDFETPDHTPDVQRIAEIVRTRLAHFDVLMLSDYDKGVLRHCRDLIDAAHTNDRRVIVDPKSQDFARYAGADLVTPNFAEFQACVGQCATERDIVDGALALCRAHEIGAILVTRGDAGMSLVSPNFPPVHERARARDVFDVTGAGDTVCAVMAASMATELSMTEAVRYANVAAGIVVGKLGTAVVRAEELLGSVLPATTGDPQAVFSELKAARARGERIVMTNGCFDILHAGHTAYLQQAKALGERLLVAVNSDASVTRLKGATRPINSLADRIAVLNALSSVDWVISFDADDPAELIEQVKPDVLVKGGDYEIDEIAGGDYVLRSGGEVKTLPLVAGLSTSGIADRIRLAKP